jgi:hypothetical protein
MKKIKNHQRPRRKYRFDILGHKKALKIWWDSPFKVGRYFLVFAAGQEISVWNLSNLSVQ